MSTDAEHVAQKLLGEQGGADFAPSVAGVEAALEPVPASLVEVLAGDEQQPADAVEGVALAAPMPDGLLLSAAAHVVDGLVRETHDAEPVEVELGVQAGADAGGVAPERVDRRDLDYRPPRERLGLEPVGHDLAGAADGHVQQDPAVQVGEAGDVVPIGTTPDPLRPHHHHHRPTEHRQIAHPHLAPSDPKR